MEVSRAVCWGLLLLRLLRLLGLGKIEPRSAIGYPHRVWHRESSLCLRARCHLLTALSKLRVPTHQLRRDLTINVLEISSACLGTSTTVVTTFSPDRPWNILPSNPSKLQPSLRYYFFTWPFIAFSPSELKFVGCWRFWVGLYRRAISYYKTKRLFLEGYVLGTLLRRWCL